MSQLVLSTFSGAEFLDRCFEAEGFCVVSAGDVLFGRDIRQFHPPAGRFDGVIGGPPCQSHSSLANLVRAKGLEPKFGDMTPDFVRIVEEARPAWFLMENVPACPDPKPAGYEVTSFLLENTWLGEAQMRKRRFWFGWTQDRGPAPNLMRWIPGVALEVMEQTNIAGPPKFGSGRLVPDSGRPAKVAAVSGDARRTPVKRGGSGKVKVTAVGGNDGVCKSGSLVRQPPVTGRNEGAGAPGKDYSPPRRTLEEMLSLQGYPPDVFGEHCPFTVQARRKLVGNAVPKAMSIAVARAIRKAMGYL